MRYKLTWIICGFYILGLTLGAVKLEWWAYLVTGFLVGSVAPYIAERYEA